jgi:hypothetical protein
MLFNHCNIIKIDGTSIDCGDQKTRLTRGEKKPLVDWKKMMWQQRLTVKDLGLKG